MDELESELRALDREIAQFVLQAFQREAPEALEAQLGAAMARALAPLQRSLDAIGGSVAEARAEIARSAQDGLGQAAAIRSDLGAQTRQAQEQAERRAFELNQAVARVREDLGHARREIRGAADARPPPETAEAAGFEAEAPAPGEGGLRRPWTWIAGGSAAVVLAAGLAAAVFWPRGPLAGDRPAEAPAATTPGAGAAPPDAGQAGFDRVVALVSSAWTGERRKQALAALCGPAGDKGDPCPTLQARWLAKPRSPKEVQAAMDVTLAALSQTDCKAPPARASESGETPPDPTAAWTCLLTEAGRATGP